MSEFDNNAEPLSAFEQALNRFTPAPPPIDRDRLMFLAGRATVEAASPANAQYAVLKTRHSDRAWVWPAATATFAATSLALAIALAVRPVSPPQIVVRERPVIVPAAATEERVASPPAPSPIAAIGDARSTSATHTGYLKTREVALRMGVDALGSLSYPAEAAGPATYRDLYFGMTSNTPSPDPTGGQVQKQSTM